MSIREQLFLQAADDGLKRLLEEMIKQYQPKNIKVKKELNICSA